MTNKVKIQNPRPPRYAKRCGQAKSQQCIPIRSGFIIILFLVWILVPAYAGIGFWISASYADTFLDSALKDGFGVRPLGMGGAFVAVSDDTNSIYYNPAAVANIKTMYTRGYMDMNTDYYSVNESWAVTAKQAGLASWNRQDKSNQKTAVTALSFGVMGDNGLSWGVTQKNIAWSLPAGGGRGWTMDAGLKGFLSKEIMAGLLIQDLVKNEVPVATSIRLGLAAYPISLKDTVIAIDGEFRNLKSANGATLYMHYGAEAKITSGLILRSGWEKGHFTAGATANFPYGVIDYALIINQDSKNTQMFGIRLGDEP